MCSQENIAYAEAPLVNHVSEAEVDMVEDNHFCNLPTVVEREFGPEVGPERVELIRINEKKWVNGTKLHYYFFDDEDSDGEEVRMTDGSVEWVTWVGSEGAKDVVRNAFGIWKNLGIGLEFEEVDSRTEAEIRIGFMRGDGSWSYLGRDVIDLDLSVDARTMNFGWDITRRARGLDTALHEIGHTLGFPHEHQNPNAGIEWDEEAVYGALAEPPNRWDRDRTFRNILRKISPDRVQGSTWDPNSIMHYSFAPGLIVNPAQFRNGLRPAPGLSARDVDWVKTFYPPIDRRLPSLKVFRPVELDMSSGEQINLKIEPTATRRYTIQTFGFADTVMVLFEDRDGNHRYMTGDDDSGTLENASIRPRLVRGREYILRVRLFHRGGSGQAAVMMW